jgi:3-deoxy-D-manno-octulosonic-acid transferase
MEAFRRCLLPLGFALHGRDPGARHVLVDAFGRVDELLPACGSAFVGGSLVPAGCHNLWEPLLAGLRIYFGPSTHNQEPLAGRLVERGLAERVTTRSQVLAWKEPDPGTAAACRAVARDHFRDLEDSEAALRARLSAALSRRGSPGAGAESPVPAGKRQSAFLSKFWG